MKKLLVFMAVILLAIPICLFSETIFDAAKKGDTNFIANYTNDINVKGFPIFTQQETPLMDAVDAGNLDAVNALIKKGANIKIADMNNNTPMTYAAKKGQTNIIATLAQQEQMLTKQRVMTTPLMYAAQNGNADALNELILLGANVNTSDANGNTALHFSAVTNTEEVPSINNSESGC